MTYSIYTLGDPRNKTKKYVGLSKDVYNRFAQHILGISGSPNQEKKAWIEELKQAGLLPDLEVIERDLPSFALARKRESYWIEFYTQSGAELMNSSVVKASRLQQARTMKTSGGRYARDGRPGKAGDQGAWVDAPYQADCTRALSVCSPQASREGEGKVYCSFDSIGAHDSRGDCSETFVVLPLTVKLKTTRPANPHR